MEVKSRAPGKIILTGEHAVVHGSTAVASSINLYTYVSLRFSTPSDDKDSLRLQLKETALEFSWPTSCSVENAKAIAALLEHLNIPEPKFGPASAVSAFLWLYSSIQGFKPATVVVTSELPLSSALTTE